MRTQPPINGIHHITAITASAADNIRFFRNILGLRLVKKTVNFDDPYTYHLYYGDSRGTPGTILTFFPWENLPRGKPGAGMVTAVAFTIPVGSIAYWKQRIAAAGISIQSDERFGEPVLQFRDPGGLPLELIGSIHPAQTSHWPAGPIPESHVIRGFHSATAALNHGEPVFELLADVMGMTLQDRRSGRYRFKAGDWKAPGHFYDVVVDDQRPKGRSGAGTVHHIAFRTADFETQLAWQSKLRAAGLGVTDVRDRKYFRSIYFRTPEGVLFEIATEPPGFTVDEVPEHLGGHLQLLGQFEPLRADIESRLPTLNAKPLKHIFETAPNSDDGRTLVLFHGFGGSEHDLLGLAAGVSRDSAALGLGGQVMENGRTRFFKRLADNIFDEADVIYRAHQAADFLLEAAAFHERDVKQLTAIGYSNGANMAAAILMVRPEIFSSAVLLRPMLPLLDWTMPDLKGKAVLILKGKQDRVIPPESTDRLAATLGEAGADVTVHDLDAGHDITSNDMVLISRWLSEMPIGLSSGIDKAVVPELYP